MCVAEMILAHRWIFNTIIHSKQNECIIHNNSSWHTKIEVYVNVSLSAEKKKREKLLKSENASHRRSWTACRLKCMWCHINNETIKQKIHNWFLLYVYERVMHKPAKVNTCEQYMMCCRCPADCRCYLEMKATQSVVKFINAIVYWKLSTFRFGIRIFIKNIS